MSAYQEQQRGDEGAYERYLTGMDASMRQKVALTAAYLLCEGRIADMGMGSGAGSHALAALYPGLDVIGVDVSETMVELAEKKYQLPNLSFRVGDISRPVLPDGSLNGILNSSVFHHVTSFGGYRYDNVADALRVQVRELCEHGVLIVRDFLAPRPAEVFLDLPTSDGDQGVDPRSCSTAALFERFSREFRSLSAGPGFQFTTAPAPKEGWRRYRVSLKHATEFLLRKDYRRDWESEAKEEYTYFSQDQFEQVFAELGLRVLSSTPLRNPWIVRNRFRGRAVVATEEGRALPFPPTNFVIAGEKTAAGEGVRFRAAGSVAARDFLRLEHHRNRETGVVYELAWRPNQTLDVLPWFERNGSILVIVRASYPRPVLSVSEEGLDGSRAPHYVTEPLNIVQTDRPVGQTVEQMLAADAGLAASALRGFSEGTTYYPSPGGTQEEVRSVLVEVDPVFVREPPLNRSGFSTSGHIRAIEAQQVLRAAQAGALPDARLELNTYELLLQRGRSTGPWIGEEVSLAGAWSPPTTSTAEELLRCPKRRVFESVSGESSSGFLEVRRTRFEELDAQSKVVATQNLEYVVPSRLSSRTVAVALLGGSQASPLLGISWDDLPAAQAFSGNSNLLIAPAWRLPTEVHDWIDADAWLRDRLRAQFGVTGGELFDLGGPYRPSPGLSPEIVHPVAMPVLSVAAAPEPLSWVPLAQCVQFRAALVDGHLRILALRAAHALEILK